MHSTGGNTKRRVMGMLDILLYGFDIERVVGNVFYVLLAMIAFDIITGVLASAKEKMVNSSINIEGLIRKAGMVIALAFVTLIDAYFRADGIITKIAVGALIAYEGISIIENFSRIGVNLDFITKYFDENKVEKKEGKSKW